MIKSLVRTAGGGGGGASTSSAIMVEVFDSTHISENLANDGKFLKLANGAVEFIRCRFPCIAAGNYRVVVEYCMSAANAGNVELRLDKLVSGPGEDPAAALTTGTEFTITPGNDVLAHEVDDGDSADFLIAASAGDRVLMTLTRTNDAADTHTGDFRMLGITVVPA
jgi:hypothetical protein